MTIVEARYPDGGLIELAEVNLSTSGLLIRITDTDGHQVLIHRNAWDGVVKTVQDLFEREKSEAREYLAQKKREDPNY